MNEGRRSFRVGLLLLLLLFVVAWMVRQPNRKELIPWRENYASASDESKKNGRPLMLWFTATWCGPCQSLKTTTWADPDVARELSNYVCVKLDVDQPDTKPLAEKYQVNGIPRFVILDKDGKVVHDAVGAMPPSDFLDWLHGKEIHELQISRARQVPSEPPLISAAAN